METTPQFDLNRAIAQWRVSLGQSPGLRRENLEELESHLRDSVANLCQRGLAEDEAFLIATRRVGSPPTLGTEFAKINSRSVWLDRALWMLIGVQAFRCIDCLEYLASVGTAVLFGSPTPIATGVLFVFVYLLTFALILVVGWRFLKPRSKGLAAWYQQNPNRLSSVMAFVMVCVIFLVLPQTAPHLASSILRYAFKTHSPLFLSGLSLGLSSAVLLESIALRALTLWLARRQLLAKT